MEPILAREAEYENLRRCYEQRPIALYLGAGVSSTASQTLGLGTWDGLLDAIAHAAIDPGAAAAFRARAKHLDPWEAAQELTHLIGAQKVQDEVVRIVRRDGTFQDSYASLLTSEFLNAATTLAALSAFCARLVGFSVGKGPRYYGRVEPNRRVTSIISTNYDPYLEAAASLMFRTMSRTYLLKPVGALGSTGGGHDQLPVFHVHGYVSPENDHRGRTPFVDPVLTAADYRDAWNDVAYSPTIGPQVHVLRHFTTLFVGFSFRDPWVGELLAKLEAERQVRGTERLHHYALVSQEALDSRGRSWFDERGLRVICWRDPKEIVDVLKGLYIAGLRQDAKRRGTIDLVEFELGTAKADARKQPTRLGSDDLDYCWDALLRSRLGRIPPPAAASR